MIEPIKYRRDLWKVLPQGGDIAEIGVAEAYYSADMLAWPGERKVYMVDRWQHVAMAGDSNQPQSWHDANYEAAMKRVAPFGERAVILRGNSVDMAAKVPDRSLALVYLDGDHSLVGVRSDMAAWAPKLMHDGILAGHDFLNPAYGVREAFETFAAEFACELHLLTEDWEQDAGVWLRAEGKMIEC